MDGCAGAATPGTAGSRRGYAPDMKKKKERDTITQTSRPWRTVRTAGWAVAVTARVGLLRQSEIVGEV